MNNKLYYKCIKANFKEILERKGYAYFSKGKYNLNIIGIRSNQNNKVTNKFDDIFVIEFYNNNNKFIKLVFYGTTDPGAFYMRKPIDKKGTAILVPGQYRSTYCLSLHNGKYKALCQRLKSVKVYRDGNKDDIYDLDPNTIQEGKFGINIHRASLSFTADTVNNYSAGCQVIANPKDYSEFIRLCEISAKIYGNSFTYTLIEEKDLI